MTEQFTRRYQFDDDRASDLLGHSMSGLSESDWRALGDLRTVHRFVGRGRRLLDEAEQVTQLRVICKGWALRSVAIDDERRQVLEFLLPGDVVGLNVDAMGRSLCDVDALTACEVAEIDMKALTRLSLQSPGIARGIQYILARTVAHTYDQVVRLGRMNAYERVASLFLDMYHRQRLQAFENTVDFPITQTIASDALGLSVVHVNRQVMRLRREGHVTLGRKQLTLHQPERLAEAVGFRDRGFNDAPMHFMAAE